MIAFLALAAPAAAQDWRMAPEYDVLLTSFQIEPHVIRLKADEAVRLRFVNNSAQAHRFVAPDFFRSVALRDHDRALVRGGALRLAPFSDETIAFVPKAGRYRAAGDNLFRRELGMKAMIVVQ
ncbi:MAG TPA: cupredoxin domain-containing protein [Allosphingosinicella sp.]|nr:cupredoxin domain-containing protein [Allosphingosinicella sp.]